MTPISKHASSANWLVGFSLGPYHGILYRNLGVIVAMSRRFPQSATQHGHMSPWRTDCEVVFLVYLLLALDGEKGKPSGEEKDGCLESQKSAPMWKYAACHDSSPKNIAVAKDSLQKVPTVFQRGRKQDFLWTRQTNSTTVAKRYPTRPSRARISRNENNLLKHPELRRVRKAWRLVHERSSFPRIAVSRRQQCTEC